MIVRLVTVATPTISNTVSTVDGRNGLTLYGWCVERGQMDATCLDGKQWSQYVGGVVAEQ